MTPDVLRAGPPDAGQCLILAHGAGAPMTSPFMAGMTALLAGHGIATACFEFAYMAARRTGAGRRPPPKAEQLIGEYLTGVAAVRETLAAEGRAPRLHIGGKSLGGRVASLVADRLFHDGRVSSLVCLGYPFHPPGKQQSLRTAHLTELACPALIVQGERDPFGSRGEIGSLKLSPTIGFHWAADGDHDLAPRRASGYTHEGNLAAAAAAVARFVTRN